MTEEKQASGLAITSLVLGILSIITCMGPILGVPGLVCGLMAMSKADKGEVGGRGVATAGAITSGIGVLAVLLLAIPVAMMLPAWTKAREKARRANCASNLKSMAVACLMYSGDNNGDFPDKYDLLDSAGYMRASRVYVCPSSELARGASPTPSQGDYLYFGAGLRDDNAMAGQVVIACDRFKNHDGEWINVLFIDGHVEGVPAGSLEELANRHGWIIPGVNDPKE